jgi:ATP-binding cassette subfamily C (CFTR/MRP) protein 1
MTQPIAMGNTDSRCSADLQSPEGTAGFLSRTMFTWVTPLFTLSRKRRKENRELEESDIWKLLNYDQTDVVAQRFRAGWDREDKRLHAKKKYKHGVQHHSDGNKENKKETTKESIERIREDNERLVRRSLFNVVQPRFMRAGFVKLMQTSLAFLLPVILNGLLSYVDDAETEEAWKGYVWALGLTAVMAARAIAANNYFHMALRCSFQVRSAINTATYRKSLRLSMASRQSNTVGEIVNIMSVSRMFRYIYGMTYISSLPCI